jgi:hypothetical protein
MTLRSHPCRGCGSPIVWAFTTNGKLAPFDAISDNAEGGFALEESPFPDTPPTAVFVPSYIRQKGTPYFVSHFATCPAADDFRHKGRP